MTLSKEAEGTNRAELLEAISDWYGVEIQRALKKLAEEIALEEMRKAAAGETAICKVPQYEADPSGPKAGWVWFNKERDTKIQKRSELISAVRRDSCLEIWT